MNDDFYQHGASLARDLAAGIGPFLLENNILALNTAIGEIEGNKYLISAAITDHKNKIVAHTDPLMINRSLISGKDEKFIEIIQGVAVGTVNLSQNEPVIRFSTPVTFSGVKIGKVYLRFSATHLFGSIQKYKTLYLYFVVLSFFLYVAVLAVKNHTYKVRVRKIEKAFEGVTQIGPYILKEKIAQGGMAELFLADYVREDGFRRVVAVKRILPHLNENTEFIKMFIREARLAALLQHPNIVQINDFGKFQDSYFIAMEYVYGKNLAEIMAVIKKGLPVDQTVFIISNISDGLHYSHSKKNDKTGEPLNIIHRDISPQNILVSFQGEVKISDFGISKARSEPSLTLAGVIKGKLSYMSPEQARGQAVDHRTDIYALGIVFYEILSGEKLYRFANEIEAIRLIPEKEIEPIMDIRPDIPPDLNTIVMKCLEKDKRMRYQSVQELRDALLEFKTKHNIVYDRLRLANFMKQHFGSDQNGTSL